MSGQLSPGILTLTSTTASAQLDIALQIPPQTLRLQTYRVQFDSAVNSLAAKVLYIELPIVSRNQIIDNNVGFVYLPIPLSENRVTLETSVNLPIYMTETLYERFEMNVRDGPGAGFALVTTVEHITLQFELSYGSL